MSLSMAGGGGSSTAVSKGHRRQESMYAMTGLYGEGEAAEAAAAMAHSSSCGEIGRPGHSRNPSDRSEKASLAASMPPLPPPSHTPPSAALMVVVVRDDNLPGDCGILRCRPPCLQRFAGIKVFVLLLSFLVTLQQALSSGYINSVITTIEKRFEIPSSLSGLVASSYEIGNVITVIFVSYLGSRRHIPVWIAVGSVIMGIGSMVFMVPHFVAEPHSGDDPALGANATSDNICRIVATVREQDMGLGRLGSGLSSPPLAPPNNLHSRGDNCIQGSPSTAGPVFLFLVAQLLLGCGGSPLFTLGTTYIDDHVRPESASLYIGCMYSMAAFGPVCGFLLGAYLLSFHMDSFSSEPITIDPGDRRWVGMWWGGFLLCGLLLVLVSVPFFAFPKTLHREKERIRLMEKARRPPLPPPPTASVSQQQSSHRFPATYASSPPSLAASPPPLSPNPPPPPPPPLSASHRASSLTSAAPSMGTPRPIVREPVVAAHKGDSGYGKDIKGEEDENSEEVSSCLSSVCCRKKAFPRDIPRSMWRLVCNPVYVVTCLGACMELIIVSGFVVFLPKYLETQFSLGKSQASVFTGSIAIPGACIGIFMGGCLLKRLELRPKGAVQFVLVSNSICLACYTLLFFLGCDNVKMAGTTIPYFNSSGKSLEPFQVNLTAACNFGCECRMTDVEPVCGNNGLTYFSPCHAGCTALSSRSNYTNCACIHGNFSSIVASASTAAGIGMVGEIGNPLNVGSARATAGEFAEVTVVPVATAGPCNSPCRTIFPFLILLFFMTFIVAITQMPLLMIVLRSVSEEERSFALGMQFVIFRLFGYIPAPILFGNLIDSTCILWKSTCGEKGGRCLLYDIEQFRFRYVGICAGIKLLALALFLIDWWLVRRRRHLEETGVITVGELVGSIISLDKIFEEHVPTLPLRIGSLDPCLPASSLTSPPENIAEIQEGNEGREDGAELEPLDANP